MNSKKTGLTRRQFVSRVGAGAALLGLQPVFSRNYLFSAPPLPATDDFVHINFNENPYGPSEKTLKAMHDAFILSNRYFDINYEETRKELAKHHNLAVENIHMGAGSTEILKICDDLFLGQKARVVVADPAYEAVLRYAANTKAEAIRIPLTKDFRHDLPKMAEAVTRDTGMVYICNPNNPTGTIVTKDEIQRFMDRIPESVPVLIDEAYHHFVEEPAYESSIRYVREGRNVVVARTFSKVYGLAGIRVGYALAKKEIIEKMVPYRVDFAINAVAYKGAITALRDTENAEKVRRLNNSLRRNLQDDMKRLGFECIPSQANFVMIHIKTPVDPVIEAFLKRKILVGRKFPALANYMRVSIGTEDDMKKFVTAFKEIFKA